MYQSSKKSHSPVGKRVQLQTEEDNSAYNIFEKIDSILGNSKKGIKLLPDVRKIKRKKSKRTKSILKRQSSKSMASSNPWGNNKLEPQFEGANIGASLKRKNMMKARNNSNFKMKMHRSKRKGSTSVKKEAGHYGDISPIWNKSLSSAFQVSQHDLSDTIIEERVRKSKPKSK
jgi:hypothetical protein